MDSLILLMVRTLPEHALARVDGRPRLLGRRPAWALVALAGLYLLAVGLLLTSHVREFADETDNLLGGVLVARGARLYVDFFSSHMPFAYYLAALPARFGVVSLEQFRVFTNALTIAATVGIVWSFRRGVPLVVLGMWAVLAVYAHTLQFGEMLTAGSCAGYGLLVAGLIFYTTPALRFSRAQILVVSAAIFVAVQSELVAVFPIVLLGACYLGVRLSQSRRTSLASESRAAAVLLVAVVLPHALVLLAFWVSGMLGDFIYDAYQFNQTFYSQFLMNASIVGMLHDWEAQYRTYLTESLRDPLGIQSSLVLANLFAAWVVSRSRGMVVGVLYYLFVALTHVRNEWAYYLCSYFSLALSLAWASTRLKLAVRSRPAAMSAPASPARAGLTPGSSALNAASQVRSWPAIVAALVVLLLANFVVRVGFTYDLSGRPPREPYDVAAITALTVPGEQIFVAPFDPYMYLASGRMPASSLTFFFPWQAIDPRMEARLFADLSVHRPPVVIFRSHEKINDRWLVSDYGSRLYDFLMAQGYAPLDAASPLVGDVLVRSDRLPADRQSLGL